MSDKRPRIDVLNALRLPATLRAEEAAALLGRSPHDMPILASAGILMPLNEVDATSNSVKYYATSDVVALCGDVKALRRMTREIARFWAKKNSRSEDRAANEERSETNVLAQIRRPC